MGTGKNRWKISFHRSPSNLKNKTQIPTEFICPISNSVMADPVITSSGQTFERNSILACKSLSYTPTLSDNSKPNFSTIIPNLALKSTILNWCNNSLTNPPKPLDFKSAQKIVQSLKDRDFTQMTHISSSSEDSAATITPLPSFYSSSSSSEIETQTQEEDEFVSKIKSSKVYEQEEALVSLREITRTQEQTRTQFCTLRLLSALKSVIVSRYVSVQVNAVAALVNLSLEKTNKVKIVRSGIIPLLIDVLRGGSPAAQDHAAGAIFSLSLDDQNKTAIGVLGALPPLIHALRSDSGRTRNDSALALYHLSLVQSNRAKLVKFGSVQVLLGMVRSGHMPGRVLLVLCNMGASVEGRAAMLDGGAVECFVGMLGRGVFESESSRESCVSALYGLSYGGLRFKGLAVEAGAEEVLKEVEREGSERVKVKVRKILEVIREKDEGEEEVDWEELLNSGVVSETRFRLGCGMDVSRSNSSEF